MSDVHPVMLPKTGKYPVPLTAIPGGEIVEICAHEGPVRVALPDKGAVGQLKTVKCSERPIAKSSLDGTRRTYIQAAR